MENFAKQCQSCGMPLKSGAQSGTEKDGSKSHMYCNLCYENGEFINPNATLEEFKATTDAALKQKGWWKPLRMMALWQLPSLKRWKK